MDYKLTRYHEYKERDEDVSMFPEPDGEWVKWEDVEPLLKAYLSLKNKYNKIKEVVSERITT
jgi:hypothetical protein